MAGNSGRRNLRRLLVVLLLGAGAVAVVLWTSPRAAVGSAPLRDFDVTFIERTPRQAHLCYQFAASAPTVVACDPQYAADPSLEPHWPEADSDVTFTAHVMNKGSAATNQGATYQWYMDNGSGPVAIQGASGSIGALAVGGEATIDYETDWAWDPETATTHDFPRLSIILTPDDTGDDAFSQNNSRVHYVLGKSFMFFVREDQYEQFNQVENGDGTYSYEDWAQAQMTAMNDVMIDSTYPGDGAPNGSLERVNVDNVYVAATLNGVNEWESEDPANNRRYYFDGIWNDQLDDFGAGYDDWFESVYDTVDYNLIHEMMHRLGAIDAYWIPYDGRQNQYCNWSMMGGHVLCGGEKLELVHVLYLNKKLPFRASSNQAHGEFRFDMPSSNTIRLMRNGGTPLPNAELVVYRQVGSKTQFAGEPLFYGRTDANGELDLPDRDIAAIDVPGFTTDGTSPFGDALYFWISVTTEDGQSRHPIVLDHMWAAVLKMRGIDDATYVLNTGLVPLANGANPPLFSELTIDEAPDPDDFYKRLLTATVSDADRVDFYVDGILRGSATAATDFEFLWDMTYEQPGKHWISARAVTLSGATITSYTLSPDLADAELGLGLVDEGDGSVIATETIAPSELWGDILTDANTVTTAIGFTNTGGVGDTLTDGDYVVQWGTSGGEGDRLQIDLGQPLDIAGLRIVGDLPRCRGTEIHAGNAPYQAGDTPLHWTWHGAADAELEIAFPERVARYVTVVCRGIVQTMRLSEIEIYGPPPPADLIVSAVDGDTRAWPSDPDPEIVHVVHVKNVGGERAPETTSEVYISSDATLDVGDTLIRTEAIESLGPGEEDTFTYTAPSNWTVASGRLRYFLSEVDVDDDVPAEDNENNNTGVKTVGLSGLPYDVDGDGTVTMDDHAIAYAMYGGPASVNRDGDIDGSNSITVSDFGLIALHLGDAADHPETHVKNTLPSPVLVGQQIAYSYNVHGCEAELLDIWIDLNGDMVREHTIPLPGSGSCEVSGTVNLAFSGQGTFTPKLYAKDTANYTDDSSWNQVVVRQPDLTITAINGDTRSGLTTGQSITHGLWVKNVGDGAPASDTTLKVYLSTDNTLVESKDTEVTSITIPAADMDPGEEHYYEYSTTPNWTVASGRSRFYISKVDDGEDIVEVLESNNTISRKVGRSNMPADVDGDGRVLTADINAVANAYQADPGETNWNPDANVTPPSYTDTITVADVSAVVAHYYEYADRPEAHFSGPTTALLNTSVTFQYEAHNWEGTVTDLDFDLNGGGTDTPPSLDVNVSNGTISGNASYTFTQNGTFYPKLTVSGSTNGTPYTDVITLPALQVSELVEKTPTSQGNYSQFVAVPTTSPSSAHYQNVDEAIGAPNDNDYYHSSSYTQKDTQKFPTTGLTNKVVDRVVLKFRWKQDAPYVTGPVAKAIFRQSNYITYSSGYSAPNAAWHYDVWEMPVNPRTGAAWTLSEVNAGLEFGFEVQGTTGSHPHISQMNLQVYYH